MSRKKFRTDPLDKNGNVDASYFASDEYTYVQVNLMHYLELEGFFERNVEYFFDFCGTKWHVYPVKTPKK